MEPRPCRAQYSVRLETRTAIGPGPAICGAGFLFSAPVMLIHRIPLEEVKTSWASSPGKTHIKKFTVTFVSRLWQVLRRETSSKNMHRKWTEPHPQTVMWPGWTSYNRLVATDLNTRDYTRVKLPRYQWVWNILGLAIISIWSKSYQHLISVKTKNITIPTWIIICWYEGRDVTHSQIK